MSGHDDRVSLIQMLAHAQEAIDLVKGRTLEDLENNRILQLAHTRLIEVVGEAASRISRQTCAKYPDVPWPHIVSMRNRLIHGYDMLDWNLLWNTICEDLPPLVDDLKRILAQKG